MQRTTLIVFLAAGLALGSGAQAADPSKVELDYCLKKCKPADDGGNNGTNTANSEVAELIEQINASSYLEPNTDLQMYADKICFFDGLSCYLHPNDEESCQAYEECTAEIRKVRACMKKCLAKPARQIRGR